MGRRTSNPLESGTRVAKVVAAFFAAALALALFFAPDAGDAQAQESTAEQTVLQAGEATTFATEVEETTQGEITRASEAPDGDAEKPEGTVAAQQSTPSEEPRQAVQQGGQQAGVGDGARVAGRATPQGQAAQIIESAQDGDEIVDSITLSAGGCEVASNASVVVRDNDGTKVTLTNNQNVTITPDDEVVRIEGTGTGGNLNGIAPSGGDGQFGTEGETVTGEVVSSSGITSCDRAGGGESDGGGGNGGTANGGTANTSSSGGCDGATVVERISGTGSRQTAPFDIRGNLFRVTSNVTATSDPDLIFFSIRVRDANGNTVATIDQESPGTQTSFVNERSGRYFLDILAANVEYTITVENCADVLGGPEGPLPPTGGPALPTVLTSVALLLAGTTVLSKLIRRRL